ncbi:hypothetical protein HDK77DRAFT_260413 [Phyllosticta capitalensis]
MAHNHSNAPCMHSFAILQHPVPTFARSLNASSCPRTLLPHSPVCLCVCHDFLQLAKRPPPPRNRAGHHLSIICACGTLETMSDHNLASALARSLDDRSRQEQRRPNEHAWGGAALHAPSGGRRLMRCVVEQSINCATCLRCCWLAGSLGPTNIASGRVRPIRAIHPLFGRPANTKTAVAVLLPPFDHPFIIIADLPTCE